ncbi:uncharacterized protein G2W53_029262 [Senna tora]|uniref:Uncharacterized protein n=1 Tax=Senna tora TaxID=362788 RepID=A0A834T500_9FABA|nr:uncharacterized protein G2W53_029262 [Senna tora]
MATEVETAKKLSCEVVIVECDTKKIVEMANENFENVSVLGMLVNNLRRAEKKL